MKSRLGWVVLLGINVVFCYVLSFYQTSVAAPATGTPPFTDSIEQRSDMVGQLKEINAQLKELNTLLRSGNLKVTVRDEKR